MDPEALQDRIQYALEYLASRVPQEYHDRWNLFTDIETNEIRPECIEDATGLWYDLEIMMKHRRVYWISELDRADDGGYIPCIAIEDEPQYFRTDWNWGTDMKLAQKIADEKNAEAGINPKEAWTILMRCMTLREKRNENVRSKRSVSKEPSSV